jgi:hypothetical protein
MVYLSFHVLLWTFQPFGVFCGLASVPFRLPFGMSMFSPLTVATSGQVSGLFLSREEFVKLSNKTLIINELIFNLRRVLPVTTAQLRQFRQN